MVSVLCGIRPDMADAFQPVDQTARRGAIAAVSGWNGTRIGGPCASAAAWSSVVRPALDRPIAWASAPLLTARIRGCRADGCLDEDLSETVVSGQNLENAL